MREEKQSSKLAKMKVKLQKLLKKRWVLPAVYLGLAALVLSTALWLQRSEEDIVGQDPDVGQEVQQGDIDVNDGDVVPVTVSNENIKMPVVDEASVKVVGHFFDFDATEEEQQAALVFYDNTYFQNQGIDLAMESGETFDVVASLSGTVVKAEKDALLGNLVHIEHDDHVVTVYQSLEDVSVEAGQSVKQGDVIAQAGRNLYNQEAGIHVHFEIRQDGAPVNPIDYFNQPITALPTQDEAVDEASDDEGSDEESDDESDEEASEEEVVEDEASDKDDEDSDQEEEQN